MLDEIKIIEVLSDEGALDTNLDYFRAREQQKELALEICKAINNDVPAVLEAGAGVGKTYAYLIPILYSDKRAIISTSTKCLQEQLCDKDIPELSMALGIEVDVRLLKGKENYTNDCRCSFQKARELAINAQIMVVNHALLLNDTALCRDEENLLLSNREVIVFDEAHTLPEDLRRYFVSRLAKRLSTHDLQCDVRSAHDWFKRNKPKQQKMIGALEDIENELVFLHSKRETDKRQVMDKKGFSALHSLNQKLTWFTEEVRENRSQVLDEKGDELSLQGWQDLQDSQDSQDLQDSQSMQSVFNSLASANGRLTSWKQQVEGHVAWAERDQHNEGWLLRRSPVDTSSLFDKYFVKKATCLFLSGTMALDERLDSFKESLGIADAKGPIVGSPFDYEKKSILLLPDDMPDPEKEPEPFVSKVADLVKRLIICNDGNAFVLVSSWDYLRKIKPKLEKILDEHYKLLVQGDSSDYKLAQIFRKASQPSVLLGTRTFWQGVDVRGSALSLVIVDKIPFDDDPLLSAEMEMCGDNAFNQVQLPQATLALKQAAGRLIRSENDQGVLVICDPRMHDERYGETILRNLPPMKTTNNMDEAADFLSSLRDGTVS